MTTRSSCSCLVAALLVAVAPAGLARADVFGDILVGLDFAGFQYQSDFNPLSQGHSFTAARNFQNTQLDFGFTDLTLTGPVSASFTTASRGIRSLDFSLIGGTTANPLFYSYTSDIGANRVQVDGSTVFNLGGSVNQFGWYDLTFQFSNRQTQNSIGRFTNPDGETIDFDIGPIDVSGNLFADLLATLTDPFYEAAGYENIFATFSGRTMREDSLESTVSQLQARLKSGENLTKQEVSDLVSRAMESRIRGDDVPDLSFLNMSGSYDPVVAQPIVLPQQAQRLVPEPSSLALLLIPACLLRRPRRR